ncbi:hypothetical protein N5W20_05405 [Candidatus Kirkpatrickella diaphorinae]|uniref:Uncharacterized protein n=1 Tax=Candidatus Kirkpatrickella diaphorinae TaxID=2984322 RepID=A0ABY6GGN6_9PROT|nr:hypothetical protein [Candidatus Kirkpatrickella diaphorinae]UYH50565.1 hypothetical protein N5W20_05405 [Candidatus Kirkpatrickella diaphorinae]
MRASALDDDMILRAVARSEEMIERGLNAKALLENETFLAVVNALTNYNLTAMMASPPGQSGIEAREYHHLLQHGLTLICSELTAWKAAGEAEEALIEQNKEMD